MKKIKGRAAKSQKNRGSFCKKTLRKNVRKYKNAVESNLWNINLCKL